MSPSTTLLIMIIGFSFMGVSLVSVSIGLIISRRMLKKRCTLPVSATVTRIEKARMNYSQNSSLKSYFPTFEYTVNGVTISKDSNIGSHKQDFHVGKTVTLYINPEDADEYYCPTDGARAVKIIFASIGGGFILMAIALAVFIFPLLK